MKTPRIVDSMSHIDDGLITEAISTAPERKPNHILRRCLIAACLALLIGAVAVAATTDMGAQLLQAFVEEDPKPDFYPHAEGYDLRLYIERISTSSLKGDIRQVPAIIREKMKNPDMFSSLASNTYLKKFATAEEGRTYIGLEPLQVPDFDWDDVPATVHAHSNDSSGEIAWLYLELFHKDGCVNVEFHADVYTEYWGQDIAYYRLRVPSINFTESFYTTANGLTLQIISGSPNENGYLSMTGFLVRDGISYKLHVSYLSADSEKATEILHKLADQFT